MGTEAPKEPDRGAGAGIGYEIGYDRGGGQKVQVTLIIEEDIVKFVRPLGKGHGPRMNAHTNDRRGPAHARQKMSIIFFLQQQLILLLSR